jgi:hypothetical protein
MNMQSNNMMQQPGGSGIMQSGPNHQQNMNPRNSEQYYDIIAQLPTDKILPSDNELKILNSLFVEKKSAMKNIFDEAYEPFIVGIIFVILSVPQVDDFIKSNIPISNNSLYFLLLIKMVAVMILFWLVKYFHLCKKE